MSTERPTPSGPIAPDLRIVEERVYRGGDGRSAGLGREVVYLPAFIRVKGALAAEATSERVLASGQVATEAIAMLRSLVDAA